MEIEWWVVEFVVEEILSVIGKFYFNLGMGFVINGGFNWGSF